MTRKLTIPQLIMMERLHQKEYTLSGKLRKLPRTLAQNSHLGIPQQHIEFMRQCRWNSGGSDKLRRLISQIRLPQNNTI
jgi:hypothetical protein